MKTITNIKRGVKHSIKHRAQRKHKTYKNKHTKTQLKQHKTHRGGADVAPTENFNKEIIIITQENVNAFIKAYANTEQNSGNTICEWLIFDFNKKVIDNTVIDNFINIIKTKFTLLIALAIDKCNLLVLPESIGTLTKLTKLTQFALHSCNLLQTLPVSIGNLKTLEILTIEACENLKHLPESIGNLSALTNLQFSGCTALINLPESIGNLKTLEILTIEACENLKHLPESIGNLSALTNLQFSGCTALINLPESIGNLKKLMSFTIEDCKNLQHLPESIGNLSALNTLNVEKCTALKHLPNRIWLLSNLKVFKCDVASLENIEILYLMPKLILKKEDADIYFTKINTTPVYSYTISTMLSLDASFKSKVNKTSEPNRVLISTAMLGMTKLINTDQPSINTTEFEKVIEDTDYLDNYIIPYELNTERSIQQQIDIFTKLRTMNDTIK